MSISIGEGGAPKREVVLETLRARMSIPEEGLVGLKKEVDYEIELLTKEKAFFALAKELAGMDGGPTAAVEVVKSFEGRAEIYDKVVFIDDPALVHTEIDWQLSHPAFRQGQGFYLEATSFDGKKGVFTAYGERYPDGEGYKNGLCLIADLTTEEQEVEVIVVPDDDNGNINDKEVVRTLVERLVAVAPASEPLATS